MADSGEAFGHANTRVRVREGAEDLNAWGRHAGGIIGIAHEERK